MTVLIRRELGRDETVVVRGVDGTEVFHRGRRPARRDPLEITDTACGESAYSNDWWTWSSLAIAQDYRPCRKCFAADEIAEFYERARARKELA